MNKMNRRMWFGAGAFLAITPWFVPPEKYRRAAEVLISNPRYKRASYKIKIHTHIFVNRPKPCTFVGERGRLWVPFFRINSSGVVPSSSKDSQDPNITVENVLRNRCVMDNICAAAEAAHGYLIDGDVVDVNLILDTEDGYRIKEMGMVCMGQNDRISPDWTC